MRTRKWVIAFIFVLGVCLAMNEGDYFPWLNGIGLALFGLAGYLATKTGR